MSIPSSERTFPDPVVEEKPEKTTFIHRLFYGKERNIEDPSLFHSISLIPFLAWVGLGVDGLSSSAYGPDESYRALFNIQGWGSHPEIAILLALAIALTVGVISWSYSGLIQHFPYSGGGYGVATKLLGPYIGLISGCALLVDYVLTITTSIASAIDQVFNVFPVYAEVWKLPIEVILVGMLIVLNLRGIKESINVIVPIFLVFCFSHIALMAGIIILHPGAPGIGAHIVQLNQEAHNDAGHLGLWVLLVIFTHAVPVPTPVSRPSPTASRPCASRRCRTPSAPCSTWPCRWPSPPAA